MFPLSFFFSGLFWKINTQQECADNKKNDRAEWSEEIKNVRLINKQRQIAKKYYQKNVFRCVLHLYLCVYIICECKICFIFRRSRFVSTLTKKHAVPFHCKACVILLLVLLLLLLCILDSRSFLTYFFCSVFSLCSVFIIYHTSFDFVVQCTVRYSTNCLCSCGFLVFSHTHPLIGLIRSASRSVYQSSIINIFYMYNINMSMRANNKFGITHTHTMHKRIHIRYTIDWLW